MSRLKVIAQNMISWFTRAWKRATEVDLETYLREREIMEERARIRSMYERGWWL